MAAGYTRITYDSAHGAADAVEKAGVDCVDARDASQQNLDVVVGDITDIENSYTRVQAFMDDLRADMDVAVQTVQGSDWESGSKDAFEGHVNDLRGDINRVEANYTEAYRQVVDAMRLYRDAVTDLHNGFSAACLNAENDFRNSATQAHTHVDQVNQISDTGLRY